MGGTEPKPVALIRNIATDYGLREARKWNISSIFARSPGHALRVPAGWEATAQGRKHIESLGILSKSTRIAALRSDLRRHVEKISEPQIRAFLDEACGCMEAGYYRAACVFSWVGAVSVLQVHVVDEYLCEFNDEMKRRDPKSREVKNIDGFGRIKEHDFLQIIEAIGMIGKNVKQQLEERLTLRNACGHPNSLKVGESVAAAHIETLFDNVFQKYA